MSHKKKSLTWTDRLRKRTTKWARRRHKPDSIPYKVSGRRIYIVPSRFGLVYALAVFILLLGSMNYSNALAFFLTFMLAAVGFVAMHFTHNNLSGIHTEPALAEPVFAGDPAILKLRLWHTDKKLHPEIILKHPDAQSHSEHCCVSHEDNFANLVIPTQTRGYATLDSFSIATRFPINLFYAWTIVFQPLRCLVYPKPTEQAPDILGEHNSHDSPKTSRRIGQDDFAGLRDYQWQDSPQHIAWKAYASRDQLMVKQFHEAQAKTVWLDIDALQHPDIEIRISQLCRLILEAQKNKQNYALRLGELSILPNQGEQHQHECLRALALFQQVGGAT